MSGSYCRNKAHTHYFKHLAKSKTNHRKDWNVSLTMHLHKHNPNAMFWSRFADSDSTKNFSALMQQTCIQGILWRLRFISIKGWVPASVVIPMFFFFPTAAIASMNCLNKPPRHNSWFRRISVDMFCSIAIYLLVAFGVKFGKLVSCGDFKHGGFVLTTGKALPGCSSCYSRN